MIRNEALAVISREELFGDDSGRGRGFSLTRRGSPKLFGPSYTGLVKFGTGLRTSKEKLMRIGELIVSGRTDYHIRQQLHCEFPGKDISRHTIAKMRVVIESARGPILCRCGLHVNHPQHCAFKNKLSGANKKLTPEAVQDIRALYRRGEWTLIKLAQKWNVSQSTVSEVVRRDYHKPVPLRLAQFKTRMYIGQLEKIKSPICRLHERRLAAPLTGEIEQVFDAKVERAIQLVEQALGELSEAARIR